MRPYILASALALSLFACGREHPTTPTIISSTTTTTTSSVPQQIETYGCVDVSKNAADYFGTPLKISPEFAFRIGDSSTRSDASGHARFDKIKTGQYQVIEEPANGWSLQSVSPNQGMIDVREGNDCAKVSFLNKQNFPDKFQGTLVGAGDVGYCGSSATAQTGSQIDAIPGIVVVMGDIAYMSGTDQQFRDCYDPFWGKHKSLTRPSPGNHEYESPDAAPYFRYFGTNAGPPGRGYYSFDVGSWHILSLNSNFSNASQKLRDEIMWLHGELARPGCKAAYWHHPVFSSGPNGPATEMREIWRILANAGVRFVMNGHEHYFEYFPPMDAEGRPDPKGTAQYISGTGGAPLYGFLVRREGYQLSQWGVLKVDLYQNGYKAEFRAIDGQIRASEGPCVP